jgi:hypothetical protein
VVLTKNLTRQNIMISICKLLYILVSWCFIFVQSSIFSISLHLSSLKSLMAAYFLMLLKQCTPNPNIYFQPMFNGKNNTLHARIWRCWVFLLDIFLHVGGFYSASICELCLIRLFHFMPNFNSDERT